MRWPTPALISPGSIFRSGVSSAAWARRARARIDRELLRAGFYDSEAIARLLVRKALGLTGGWPAAPLTHSIPAPQGQDASLERPQRGRKAASRRPPHSPSRRSPRRATAVRCAPRRPRRMAAGDGRANPRDRGAGPVLVRNGCRQRIQRWGRAIRRACPGHRGRPRVAVDADKLIAPEVAAGPDDDPRASHAGSSAVSWPRCRSCAPASTASSSATS